MALPLAFFLTIQLGLQDYYEKGDIRQCLKKGASVPLDSLSRAEKFYYAECLYLSGEFESSFPIFSLLLYQDDSIGRHAFNRIVDIYLQKQDNQALESIKKHASHLKNESYLALRLLRLFLQKKDWANFLFFYSRNPLPLGRENWQRLLGEKSPEISQIIELSPYSDEEKNRLKIEHLILTGDYDKARFLLQSENAISFDQKKWLSFILHLSEKKEKYAFEEAQALCHEKTALCHEIAEAFFEKGFAEFSLKILEIAEAKGHYFYERKIFYLLSLKKSEEAIMELEKARQEEKIPLYLYEQLRMNIQRQLGIRAYLAKLEVVPKERCRLSLEAAISYMAELSNEELSKLFVECRIADNKEIFHRIYQNLYHNARYQLMLSLYGKEVDQDSQLSRLYIKALFSQGRYQEALAANEKLLQKFPQDLQLHRDKEQILFQMKDFKAVRELWERHPSEENLELYLLCLFALRDYESLAKYLSQLEPRRERYYYEALWSLTQNQLPQAEALLEKYLEDPGKKGNEAVYLLFLLRHFPRDEESASLALLVARFPHLLKDEDFITYPWLKEKSAKPKSEQEALLLYWYARYLMLEKKTREEGFAILKKLISLEEARFLREEILFYLARENQQESLLLREFPASPFRVLFK
ncbi:MAG: hypothetical protein NZM25_10090 [Leptospiraceae bacterium]|nr:hypothetical protein [Leptospiraceae bacterium]MDW8307499.1 hypothetical protein [Leptospiraceae bacterium]